jgi:3',5'-cyclic AMP phosphodiesterase CpdA
MLPLRKPFVCKTILVAGILFMLVGSSGGYPTAPLLFGPYTQRSQADSVVVSWMTVMPTRRNEVHWGASPTFGNITVEQGICATTFHTVKIRGLSAGLQYYYAVVSDETESSLYSFWTTFPQNETIRFAVYGDSQGDWDNWQTVSLVAQAIEKEKPAFVLKTGDLVDNGRNLCYWIDFFTASSFLHNSTLYPVLGNHENYSHWFFSFFSLPFNERWYSFENGPVHFIGLDSNRRDRYRLVQYFWLFHDLQTHSQSFTVVFFHHPLYSSGEHGNTTCLQRIWAPMFERFHVDIVFNGHDHDYERSIVDGVTYIVTGGGGSHLYDVGHSPWTVYSEKTYHYCLLTVNSSKLTFEAKKPDGSVFDSFLLTR